MSVNAWLYFGFTALLALVLAGLMVYLYRSKRKDRVESPKYRMMDED
ncbi:MAG: CcoQ/FixQ family Cbb3-type cytochrome c oxidase assembly chaperone [Nitrospirae bacterium]|nr:CcoQ/FixQ family Cbb3-type cytochrome c oxidase assembly chaperone [Nitrospirota bacterium]NTW64931.1 CcoQ/FixQ family Cbb3-type cytochrome c oxidase assembly chaperone [Nitrospirota bacterium]